jgi:hypothetical protein
MIKLQMLIKQRLIKNQFKELLQIKKKDHQLNLRKYNTKMVINLTDKIEEVIKVETEMAKEDIIINKVKKEFTNQDINKNQILKAMMLIVIQTLHCKK